MLLRYEKVGAERLGDFAPTQIVLPIGTAFVEAGCTVGLSNIDCGLTMNMQPQCLKEFGMSKLLITAGLAAGILLSSLMTTSVEAGAAIGIDIMVAAVKSAAAQPSATVQVTAVQVTADTQTAMAQAAMQHTTEATATVTRLDTQADTPVFILAAIVATMVATAAMAIQYRLPRWLRFYPGVYSNRAGVGIGIGAGVGGVTRLDY